MDAANTQGEQKVVVSAELSDDGGGEADVYKVWAGFAAGKDCLE